MSDARVSLGLGKEHGGGGGDEDGILVRVWPSVCSVPLSESLCFSEDSILSVEQTSFPAVIF